MIKEKKKNQKSRSVRSLKNYLFRDAMVDKKLGLTNGETVTLYRGEDSKLYDVESIMRKLKEKNYDISEKNKKDMLEDENAQGRYFTRDERLARESYAKYAKGKVSAVIIPKDKLQEYNIVNIEPKEVYYKGYILKEDPRSFALYVTPRHSEEKIDMKKEAFFLPKDEAEKRIKLYDYEDYGNKSGWAPFIGGIRRKNKKVKVKGHKRNYNGKMIKVKGYKKEIVNKLYGFRDGVNVYNGEGDNHITAQIDNKEYNYSKQNPEERLFTAPFMKGNYEKRMNEREIGRGLGLKSISSNGRNRYVQNGAECIDITCEVASKHGFDKRPIFRAEQLTKDLIDAHNEGDKVRALKIIDRNSNVKFYDHKLFRDLDIDVKKEQERKLDNNIRDSYSFIGFLRKKRW